MEQRELQPASCDARQQPIVPPFSRAHPCAGAPAGLQFPNRRREIDPVIGSFGLESAQRHFRYKVIGMLFENQISAGSRRKYIFTQVDKIDSRPNAFRGGDCIAIGNVESIIERPETDDLVRR